MKAKLRIARDRQPFTTAGIKLKIPLAQRNRLLCRLPPRVDALHVAAPQAGGDMHSVFYGQGWMIRPQLFIAINKAGEPGGACHTTVSLVLTVGPGRRLLDTVRFHKHNLVGERYNRAGAKELHTRREQQVVSKHLGLLKEAIAILIGKDLDPATVCSWFSGRPGRRRWIIAHLDNPHASPGIETNCHWVDHLRFAGCQFNREARPEVKCLNRLGGRERLPALLGGGWQRSCDSEPNSGQDYGRPVLYNLHWCLSGDSCRTAAAQLYPATTPVGFSGTFSYVCKQSLSTDSAAGPAGLERLAARVLATAESVTVYRSAGLLGRNHPWFGRNRAARSCSQPVDLGSTTR